MGRGAVCTVRLSDHHRPHGVRRGQRSAIANQVSAKSAIVHCQKLFMRLPHIIVHGIDGNVAKGRRFFNHIQLELWDKP